MPQTFTISTGRRPPVDLAAFREAMAGVASSAFIVTAGRGAARIGRTVTSAMSLSAEPPAILVSIDRGSALADLIAFENGFSFALLETGQAEIADAFAGALPPDLRFAPDEWSEWHSGHPRLAGAVLAADCEVIGAIETGSHILFAGGLVDLEAHPDRHPLIWHRRQYRNLAP